MNYKEEYNRLVDLLKSKAKENNVRLRNEDIAEQLSYTRSYFSTLLGKGGKVEKSHIDALKAHFSNELNGVFKPSKPNDLLNRERALLKVLLSEVAKISSAYYNKPIEQILNEINQNTTIEMNSLQGEQ